MAKKKDKWTQPEAPPPPLFTGQKERDLVKQVNDELIERVIGQTVLYYPISVEASNFHPLYGESLRKSFLSPVRVHALIKWEGFQTVTNNFGVDRRPSMTIQFHKRRLTEDQNLFVRVGDFVLYGQSFFEIVSTNEPNQLFGQNDYRYEIEAKCIKSRESTFDAK